jgi:predicted small metal-binding protein
MKILRCRDAGFDCDYEIRAQSEEEVLREAAEHAQQVHRVEVTPELAAQVQSLIRDLAQDDNTVTRNPQ